MKTLDSWFAGAKRKASTTAGGGAGEAAAEEGAAQATAAKRPKLDEVAVVELDSQSQTESKGTGAAAVAIIPAAAPAALAVAAAAPAAPVPAPAAASPAAAAAATAPATPAAGDEVARVAAVLTASAHESWRPHVAAEFAKPYARKLLTFLLARRKSKTVYPPPGLELNALALTPLDGVNVVILGQDPYHGAGQAHGLAFSVQRGVAIPPSLRNMLAEAGANIGEPGLGKAAKHGNLEHWARQGVLLLNAVLTVDASDANSHAGQGWETFTSELVRLVSKVNSGVVFMLWGKPAQEKGRVIDRTRGHLVLEAPHPSPLSAHRGYLGCGHFSKANDFLASKGKAVIDWHLD